VGLLLKASGTVGIPEGEDILEYAMIPYAEGEGEKYTIFNDSIFITFPRVKDASLCSPVRRKVATEFILRRQGPGYLDLDSGF
jgi:hypothetical protein